MFSSFLNIKFYIICDIRVFYSASIRNLRKLEFAG